MDNFEPPQVPPRMSAAQAQQNPVLGESADDRAPVNSLGAVVDSALRHPRRVFYHLREGSPGRLVGWMAAGAVGTALVYGLVVGTFSMGTQLWAAPVKIAVGLLVSALLCLPSLYVFACLSGSRARLAELAGLQAGLLLVAGLLLAGFAPVAWLFSQSTASVGWMGALHLLFWLIALVFGMRFMFAGFRHFSARSSAGLVTWMFIFLLVTLQMTTALRPLVGTADSFLPKTKKFFLAHWAEQLSGRTSEPKSATLSEP